MFIAPIPDEEEPVQRLKVMIADDVMETRRSTRLMLTLIPEVEVVAIAHNGRQAIELAQTHLPDIALMDVQMPEMDGLTAIAKMTQIRPDLACIVISAERDRDTLRKAMIAGARDYLLKPYTADQIIEVMHRVIAMVRAQKAQIESSLGGTQPLQPDRRVELVRRAGEHLRARRTDDETIALLEELASDPDCDNNWLTALSMVYLVRRKWGKLKELAARLEKTTHVGIPLPV